MATASLHPTHTSRPFRAGQVRYEAVAAGLLGAAAVAHLLLVPTQVVSWPAAGLFFGLVGTMQAILAAALLRRCDVRTVLAALGGTVAVVGVYVWSRTNAFPFAPVSDPHASHIGHSIGSQAGHAPGGHGNGVPIFPDVAAAPRALSVGPLDVSVLLAELVAIAALVALLPARQRRWASNALLALGLAMIALRATALA
jgi:hypothetical protein